MMLLTHASRRTSSFAALPFFALLVLILSGCDSPRPEPNTTADSGKKLTPVTLMLNWFPEAEHGGFYAAEQLGFYEDAGFDVTIIPGGKTTVVAQELALGRIEFGVANADDVLTAAQQDAAMIALMTPMQHTPRCILVPKSLGITKFEELTDLTLLLDSSRAFVPYLQKLGYLKKSVTISPYFGSIAPLVANERYGCQGYSFSEPFLARQEGLDVNLLMVRDVGYDPYCSLLVTSQKMIKEQPDAVRKITQASIRGWEAYLNNARVTNELILSQNNQGMTIEALDFGAEAIAQLSNPPEGMSFGQMTAERWETLIDQLEQVGFVDIGRFQPSDVFDPQFAQP